MVALGLFVSLSCSDMVKGKGASETAVVYFHELFNEKKFKEIYVDSAADFQKSTSEENLTKLLNAIHTKLGKVLASEQKQWKLNNHNLKTYVLLVQETSFEQGKATETFTFLVKDNQAFLITYNINSMDLIIK